MNDPHITQLLRDTHPTPLPAIDLESAARRIRQTRRRKTIFAGVGASVVILGLVLLDLRVTSIDRPGDGVPSAQQGPDRLAPVDKLNLCGGTVANIPTSTLGLTVTVTFPTTASTTSSSIDGTATLTNTSHTTVRAVISDPAVTLARDGLTVWHSSGHTAQPAIPVDLAAGDSITLPASVVPEQCSIQDDEQPSIPDSLPRATPGTYTISVALDVVELTTPDRLTTREVVSGTATNPLVLVAG